MNTNSGQPISSREFDYDLRRLIPRDLLGPGGCVQVAQWGTWYLASYSPGLLAVDLTSVCAVAPQAKRHGLGRTQHFLSSGALFETTMGADGSLSPSSRIRQELQRSRSEIAQLFSVSYDVQQASHGDIRMALGGDLTDLPFFTITVTSSAPPASWVRLLWQQPMLDEMLKLPGCSAMGFRIAKVFSDPQNPAVARYHSVVMTIGLDEHSPAIVRLKKELSGCGVVVIDKPAPNNRPTIMITPVMSNFQRTEVTEMRSFFPISGSLISVSSALDAELVALHLSLPQRLLPY